MTDQDRYYDSAAETTRAHRLDEAATEMAVARILNYAVDSTPRSCILGGNQGELRNDV